LDDASGAIDNHNPGSTKSRKPTTARSPKAVFFSRLNGLLSLIQFFFGANFFFFNVSDFSAPSVQNPTWHVDPRFHFATRRPDTLGSFDPIIRIAHSLYGGLFLERTL
jgi:hypothetical protein